MCHRCDQAQATDLRESVLMLCEVERIPQHVSISALAEVVGVLCARNGADRESMKAVCKLLLVAYEAQSDRIRVERLKEAN